MIPDWLTILSAVSLTVAFVCAAIIAVDIAKHPQHMWIMNVVWPVTALFGSIAALLAYFRYGRLAEDSKARAAMERDETPPHKALTPFPVKVGKGTSHCGSGCTLGDICAEWLAFLVPAIAVWLGWKSIFPEKIYAVWIVDYIFAFAIGVVFQYFTIAPMRGLSLGPGLVQAVKADALSLTAWQVGMYGFMAFAHFYLFKTLLGAKLAVNTPEFWFMMQIAMWAGFATAYPVNWWLIRKGIKESM
ncbi:MAG: hypothetical protein CMM50_07590 [Rhodospirillaceae bacterium]|nr:hypothetical protein [Rhodospirillaceae bacterium]|tara:strand:+ start:325 stop:1059 length:735 start_codon:yes stop_codon:yes gene_type:complete